MTSAETEITNQFFHETMLTGVATTIASTPTYGGILKSNLKQNKLKAIDGVAGMFEGWGFEDGFMVEVKVSKALQSNVKMKTLKAYVGAT